MMIRAASFGSERKIVFAITNAESGEDKPLFLSLLVKCPFQFKSECKDGNVMGSVTKGVWTYDKQLTCCALSLVHGIADTSPCLCTLKSYGASNLKSWFESANDDKCIHQDEGYSSLAYTSFGSIVPY